MLHIRSTAKTSSARTDPVNTSLYRLSPGQPMPHFSMPRLRPDVAILLLRAAGLFLKLGLTVFIARYMGMTSVAHYGYIAAAAAILPIALGFGMIQDLGRQLVTNGLLAIIPTLRCYWRCVCALYLVAALLLAACLPAGFELRPLHVVLATVILVLEHLNNDAYFILSNLRRPLFSNLQMFVRAAGWIAVYIPAAFLFSPLRSTTALLLFWLGGLFAAWCMFLASCPAYRQHEARLQPHCLADMRQRLGRNTTLYLGEAANASAVHIDRYVVGLAMGHVAAGIYVLFSSVATGIYTLVNTTVMHVARPVLIAHHAGGRHFHFRQVHARALRRTALLGATIALLVAVAVHAALPLLGRPDIAMQESTLHILLLATVIRAISDMQGYVFYTQRLDRLFLYTALFTVATYLAASALLLPLAGLAGAAAAVACAFTATLGLRSCLIRRQRELE
ncbi:hypothetical protein D3C81_610400 [compost metagenome]